MDQRGTFGDVVEAPSADAVRAGAAVYRPWTLRLYDVWVHGVSNAIAWRCPTRALLDAYDRNVSARHLDVGVGSGFFLSQCRFPVAEPRVTLVDLNPASLAFTSARIRRYRPTVHQANVFELTTLPEAPFDSIALMYLLHCLPGTLATKSRLFERLGKLLAPEGVLFGATILGRGVERSLPARVLMRVYNAKGIFSNADDTLADLEAGLRRAFVEVRVSLHGMVAVFEARQPRATHALS
ncbi:MAG: class I SAM-dependent methyltransferase [Pseudomonadota bacterium]